jgi:spoIIIJ-associated protein
LDRFFHKKPDVPHQLHAFLLEFPVRLLKEKGWRFRPIFYDGGMPNPAARETLELLLGHLGLVFEVEESDQGGRTVLNVRTREPARIVGRDGHNLEEIQYLLNRILNRSEEGASNVIVDVEGHRHKETLDFIGRIRLYADDVRRTGESYRLAPMNSYDRRLVHQAFADDPDIATQSEEGSARLKSVTLVPKKGR